MKFKIEVERHFPHPITDLWHSITTNEGISGWLLETSNFRPEIGHRFEMTCTNEDGNVEIYRCQVLEIEAPRRMVWSWVLAGKEAEGLTEVEFKLSQTNTGTNVTLIHRGDRDQTIIDRFESGWPSKLNRLAEIVAQRNAGQPAAE